MVRRRTATPGEGYEYVPGKQPGNVANVATVFSAFLLPLLLRRCHGVNTERHHSKWFDSAYAAMQIVSASALLEGLSSAIIDTK